jgi:hypothetical protein
MSKNDATSFTENFLDTRDLEDRRYYLSEVADTCQEAESSEDFYDGYYVYECDDFDCPIHNQDIRDELDLLERIADEVDGYVYGVTLIHENYRETYAEDYASEIHGTDNSLFGYVDWESYAQDMFSDYDEITVDGQTFYYL